MPNTKMISSEIVLEIAKVEQQGQLAYEALSSGPAGALEGATQPQAISEANE